VLLHFDRPLRVVYSQQKQSKERYQAVILKKEKKKNTGPFLEN
jgi:hypothetical protein